MAVAGVQIYIGCKVFRVLQSDTAVPTLESPSGGQRRTSGRPSFNLAIASMQFKRLKPATGPNMSIAGSGMQLTFNPIDLLRAVSAAQIHVALEAVHLDLAIARMQIDAAFARHMDIDVHMMAANFEVEIVMREANLECNFIALLMIFNPDTVFPDLIAKSRDLGFNRVLFPRGNANVGVRGLHPEFRLARKFEGFRPFVGADLQCGRKSEPENYPCQTLHGILPLRTHTSAPALRREYGADVR